MTYLLQVIIYTAIMLVGYVLFLRNKPLYQFSRYYLLASAIVPLILPLVQLPREMQQQIQNTAPFHFTLPEIIVGTSATGADFDPTSTIWYVYTMITLLFIGWHLGNGYQLWHIIKNNRKERHGSYTIIASCGYGPGSFGKYIFFPGAEINNTILEHEQAHINLHHTRDILILNLLQALIWPNLFLAWIRKELKQVHEFQADASVAANKEEYTALLLSSVFNTSHIPSMHLFFIHPIKRRIMMLQKKGKASPLKSSLLIGTALSFFILVAIAIQSCEKKRTATVTEQNNLDPNTDPRLIEAFQKAKDKSPHGTPNPDYDGIYTYVKKMPETNYNVGQFFADNLQYPAYARDKKIQGRVLIKFIIDENGEIKNAVVVRTPDTSLSNEALRIVRKMPKWIPGEHDGKKVAVYFTQPIAFKLN